LPPSSGVWCSVENPLLHRLPDPGLPAVDVEDRRHPALLHQHPRGVGDAAGSGDVEGAVGRGYPGGLDGLVERGLGLPVIDAGVVAVAVGEPARTPAFEK
jgi:hypothetical protein